MSTHVATRPRLRAEVLIVLGLSLGWSAVQSVWILVERYLRETPIGEQTTTLNQSVTQVDVMDLIYQLLRIGFSLMPVLLAVYLLAGPGMTGLRRLGLTRGSAPGESVLGDVTRGAGLAALIGIPGLGVYYIGRAIGQTVSINTSGLPDQWWTALVLLLAAAAAAVLEETVAVGYLVTRLREMAWGAPAAIATSAVLRGSYHLYQGWPMALGNAVMGAVFAWYFVKRGRVGPLIAAHATLDLVAFVGPEVLPDSWLAGIGLV